MNKPLRFLLLLFSISIFIAASDRRYIYIDTFNNPSGSLNNWGGRTDSAMNYYNIVKEGANGYLSARNDKTDNFIIKKIKVDIVKYPYLNWRWRAIKLPPGGDESRKPTCDVVASVNVILQASKWRPKTIKYSWSTTLAKGTFTESPYAIWPSRADIIVLQSGPSLKGKWVTEKRNVLKDYKKLYEEDDVDSFVIDAIVIMSDGDNTLSQVAADYDEIYFSKD